MVIIIKMKRLLVVWTLLIVISFESYSQQSMDTINIPEITINSSIKTDEIQKITSSVNSYNQQYINNHNVHDFKDFSALRLRCLFQIMVQKSQAQYI